MICLAAVLRFSIKTEIVPVRLFRIARAGTDKFKEET